MEWDPERQCLSCPNCGSSVPVMRDVPQLPVPFEWGTVPPEIGKLSEFSDSPVICPSCHADIRPREETVSMLCPYCGTALVFDEKQSFYLTPNGVVPEAISLRQAMKSVEKWSRTHFFAPTVFPKLIEKKFIRNCYVPFWVFSANIAYSFEGVGSTFSERAAGLSGTSSYLARKHRREQKSEHQCSGRNRFTASDVRICASSKLSRAASDAISAVSYGKVCDYRPEYLAGRIVDLGNIGIETGMKQAEARMREMAEIHAKAMIMSHGYTSVRITSFSIKISDASYSQILIPCYRDMDPYDLPEQLSVLMSYDMGKIGFIQDLIRGVDKVLSAEKKEETVRETVKETVVVQQSGDSAARITAAMDRGFMALEDGEWNKAVSFFDQVLSLDAKNARAYYGMALAKNQCKDASA